jgi:hypothetical protein
MIPAIRHYYSGEYGFLAITKTLVPKNLLTGTNFSMFKKLSTKKLTHFDDGFKSELTLFFLLSFLITQTKGNMDPKI